MKTNILTICAFLFISTSFLNAQDKIKNLKTFAKAYGYAKYFHPSDEAANIDWNYFSAYGAEEIIKCKNQTEVIKTLNKLFQPIGPGIKFSETPEKYNFSAISPGNTEGYLPIYWQHQGVSKDMNYTHSQSPYSSVRVNELVEVNDDEQYGMLNTNIEAERYRGKEIKISGKAKVRSESVGTGHFYIRVDNTDGTAGYSDYMSDNPISSTEWNHYEIIGTVDHLASNIQLGGYVHGNATLYLDSIILSYKVNNEWAEIPSINDEILVDKSQSVNKHSKWNTQGKKFSFQIENTAINDDVKCAVIAYNDGKETAEPIFDFYPKFGEIIDKKIGDEVYCQIPLVLYCNEEGTYPIRNQTKYSTAHLNGIKEGPDDLSLRLGNIINTYNVFQHFYPYFDVVNIDWDKELKTALEQCFIDQNHNDHKITLQKFTAPLQDGHIFVMDGKRDWFTPPITWELIEGKLVITEVLQDDLDIQIGDIVTKVNNVPTEEFMNEIKSRISAATEGYMNHIAKTSSLIGKKDTELTIEINNRTIFLKRAKIKYDKIGISIQKHDYKYLDNGIMYLNLGKLETDTIIKLLPKLEQAKGIICDLRGYPKGSSEFISHLLSKIDTSKSWMKVSQMVYPDQEAIHGYKNHGWELIPKAPYLGDKRIVFIIDGRAISYAESYMSFIEHYDLATIIGQPTAGTNGNVTTFNLLGDINIRWTGMKVVKHNGSQFHGIGILPDIYVKKTIEGIKAGKDEFLEKAIEIINK